MAKENTIRTSVHKKLEQLGTSLINQANNNKALEDIGNTKDVTSLRNALNNIFDEVGAGEYNATRLNDVLSKGKNLLSLIRSNHYSVKDSTNFDTEAIEQDLGDVQDIIFRIESIKTVHKDQLRKMNELHNKHTNLQKLIKPIGRS
jgi:hypothetical protein